MLSERQKKIIKLLRSDNYSVHQLADKLHVSDRTINREIKSLNQILTSIASITNNGLCHLSIQSSVKFFQILERGIPDKIRFLQMIILKKKVVIDDVIDTLYITKAKIKDYIDQLNSEFALLLSIKLKQGTGIVLKIENNTRIDLEANILLNYPEINDIFVDYHSLNLNNYYLNLAQRYISKDEINDKQLSCKLLKISTNEQNKYFNRKNDLLNQVLDEQKDIQIAIIKIFSDNGFNLTNEKYINILFNHILREVLFPSLLLRNKSDIKLYLKQQPIAFDIGKRISIDLRNKFYGLYVNPYYLSLYVMLALSTYDKSVYKVALVSRRKSISTINKFIIENKIKHSSVYIINNLNQMAKLTDKFVVILDSELVDNKFLSVNNADLVISSLITDNDLKNLQKILRKKTFQPLIVNMNQNATYEITNTSSDFLIVLNKFLDLLKSKRLITGIEESGLINREKAGNQLVISNVSLPHIISSRNNYRLFQAKLSVPVVVEQQFVDTIIVVIIGANVSSKSEIFKYLYELISNTK